VIADVGLLLARGFLQVAPVAASTYFVSHDRPALAVGVGWWISFVWWMNAGSASTLTGPHWAFVYATGAALGTYAGQWAARQIGSRRKASGTANGGT
jgi:hypothetical protein